jgi:hypothetical protein
VVGGEQALAERPRVSPALVRIWSAGKVVPPPTVFFRMVDIVQAADPNYRVPSDAGCEPRGGEYDRHVMCYKLLIIEQLIREMSCFP